MLGKGLESLIPPPKKSDGEESARMSEEVSSSTPPSSSPPLPREPEARIAQRISPKVFPKKGDSEAIFHIEVEKIKPNPFQPRRHFDEQALRELASSIRDFGFLQPLVVSKVEKEAPHGLEVEYQLIAGERRWLAAKLLGLERVPAIVRSVNIERERLEMAIIENLQRENLNPIEMARAFTRLQDEFKLTQREIASELGKSRETVANTVRLLDLPPAIQRAIEMGQITESHGRLLLAIDDQAAQQKLFEDLLANRLTTRELKEKTKKKREVLVPPPLTPELQSFQEKLSSELGAPVEIEDKGGTGKIMINFYSEEELRNIIERLAGEEKPELEP